MDCNEHGMPPTGDNKETCTSGASEEDAWVGVGSGEREDALNAGIKQIYTARIERNSKI